MDQMTEMAIGYGPIVLNAIKALIILIVGWIVLAPFRVWCAKMFLPTTDWTTLSAILPQRS